MDREIQKMFSTDRIPNIQSSVLVFAYLPIGILLFLLRICLLLNFVIARQLLKLIMKENNPVFKNISWIYMVILGVKVSVNGAICANVLISNQKSNIDGFIFSHGLNVVSENKWNLGPFMRKILRLENFKNIVAGKTLPIVIFPEGCPTTGAGILKFETSYFKRTNCVQVGAISTYRILPISTATAHSTLIGDMFWMLFTPVTSYTIQLSETVVKRDDNMSENDFLNSTMTQISNMLRVPVLTISCQDKNKYFENLRRQREAQKRAISNASQKLLHMASKVQEIVPHVPRNVILNDLAKTNSIDVTLTNIFEGIVKFSPIKPKPKKQPKVKQPSPQSLLEKRKAEMYEMARKRYKEKHEL
ncbi:lipid droplet-regulating VLDL assembly factor AUP1-like [Styela clava]